VQGRPRLPVFFDLWGWNWAPRVTPLYFLSLPPNFTEYMLLSRSKLIFPWLVWVIPIFPRCLFSWLRSNFFMPIWLKFLLWSVDGLRWFSFPSGERFKDPVVLFGSPTLSTYSPLWPASSAYARRTRCSFRYSGLFSSAPGWLLFPEQFLGPFHGGPPYFLLLFKRIEVWTDPIRVVCDLFFFSLPGFLPRTLPCFCFCGIIF